jgi:hypothetical protein
MIDAVSLLAVGGVSALTTLAIMGILIKRVVNSLQRSIFTYVSGISEDVSKEPDKYADLLAPVLTSAANKMLKNVPPGALAQFGGNNGGGGILDALPIPKKYKGLAQLAIMFMGGMQPKQPAEAQSNAANKGMG